MDDLRRRLDWSVFSTEYYTQELYHRFNVFGDMPIIQNPKSPVPDKRDFTAPDGNLKEIPTERHQRKWDTWLAKVSQIPKSDLVYAPTNWAGVLPDDPEARLAYEITIKFNGSKAICGEDNWGFARLYDPRFASSRTVLWQTLFGLANGMQGSVVYTAVQGKNTDISLDNEFMIPGYPCPASAPITVTGEKTEKYRALCSLVDLLDEHSITLARPKAEVAWGNYGPYAQLAMWNDNDQTWTETFKKLRQEPIRAGYKGLDNFARQMTRDGFDYAIINLESETLSPKKTPALALVSGFYMDKETQRKLIDYANNGGKLFLYGEIPERDLKFEFCDILEMETKTNDNIFYNRKNPFDSPKSAQFSEKLIDTGIEPRVQSSNPNFYIRELVGKNHNYVFIFSTSTEEQTGLVKIGDTKIPATLAPRGTEVYSVSGGNAKRIYTTAVFS